MAFIVEDGSKDPDATSYADVADFKTHHNDRGRDVSSYTDPQIEQALIKATDYIDKRFGQRFRGVRASKNQALEWPRDDAFDDDGFLLSGVDEVPRKLVKSTFEYGLIVLRLVEEELLPIPARPFATISETDGSTVSGGVSGQVTQLTEKVGPLSVSTSYSDRARNPDYNTAVKSSLIDDLHIPEYPRADLWLEELLRSSMNIRLARGD